MDDPMEAKATAPVDLRPHPASLTAIASTDNQSVSLLPATATRHTAPAPALDTKQAQHVATPTLPSSTTTLAVDTQRYAAFTHLKSESSEEESISLTLPPPSRTRRRRGSRRSGPTTMSPSDASYHGLSNLLVIAMALLFGILFG